MKIFIFYQTWISRWTSGSNQNRNNKIKNDNKLKYILAFGIQTGYTLNSYFNENLLFKENEILIDQVKRKDDKYIWYIKDKRYK